MFFHKVALVRIPAKTIDQGLRLKDIGTPDVKKAIRQHQKYCETLALFGYTLIVLPPDTQYPDSVFVEDPAIILKRMLIKGQMRKLERRGEEDAVYNALALYFRHHLAITDGFLEGGDVLITPHCLYVGISSRTNYDGAEQLAQIAKKYYALETKFIELPKHFLHLKGQVSFHRGEHTQYPGGLLMVHEELVNDFCDSAYHVIVTPHNERFGANAISDANQIMIHAGRPCTKKLLEKAGFRVTPLAMSEFEKIDGALSCLSKLFT